jgi:hypothetical protein
VERDDTWKQHKDWDEQLQITSEEDAFLSFGEVFSTERPLNDVLIERPVEQVRENHPGEDG